MKRIAVLAAGLLLAVGAGCDRFGPPPSPEAVASEHVAERLSGLGADTRSLAVMIVESDADRAVVQVSGPVEIDARLELVRHENRWRVAAAEAPEADSPR